MSADEGVICAGRIYCDLVFTGLDRFPSLGTEIFAERLGVHAGGGAFITAATLVALGRPAALWGFIPAEPFGAVVRREIDASGVDAARCAPAIGAEPQITVAIVTEGDRAFLTRAPGHALPTATLHGPRHLHIGELRTLQEHPEIIQLARKAGMTVSLDSGWDEGLSVDAAPLIGAVDVFLPNESEAARLESLGLLMQPAPLTVVKRGKSGASAISADGRIDVPAPVVTVVDTTGAGDAFNAGFLDRWLGGAEIAECLSAGNACGAAAVQAVGGVGGLSLIRPTTSGD